MDYKLWSKDSNLCDFLNIWSNLIYKGKIEVFSTNFCINVFTNCFFIVCHFFLWNFKKDAIFWKSFLFAKSLPRQKKLREKSQGLSHKTPCNYSPDVMDQNNLKNDVKNYVILQKNPIYSTFLITIASFYKMTRIFKFRSWIKISFPENI